MATSLYHAENDQLTITIYADASADMLDKSSGEHWHMGRIAMQEEGPVDIGHVWLRTGRSTCEQYPGRFTGERQGDAIRFTLFGRENQVIGQFSVTPKLDGQWFELSLHDIDASIPCLQFPPPIENESLVVPHGIGRWITKPVQPTYWVYTSHLAMRWFGGLRGEHGWMCVLHEGYADAGVLLRELSASPAWRTSLGNWRGGQRRLRYCFTQGGYVGMAKAFRAYAQQHGLVRTLREKIAERPHVANMLGGPMLSFYQGFTHKAERYEERLRPLPPALRETSDDLEIVASHADVRRVVEDAQTLGITRGAINIRGWINGGYDETHPDIWPPEPRFGTPDELRALLELPDPLLPMLHDNYLDMYRQSASFPRGIAVRANNELLEGGYWSGGQAYILNPRDALAYAQRNWAQIKTLNPRAMFIDTTTAIQLCESFEAGNTCTRSQDIEYKIELLKLYLEDGQALGSEEAADFGVPYVDWLETRHSRVAGESIPLWPLVFHDTAFCYRYSSPGENEASIGSAPNYLADMLWGYAPLWAIHQGIPWQPQRDAFARSGFIGEWHSRVGLDVMTTHRYLGDDVEMTEFESSAIVCNFGSEPVEAEGITVPAYGYAIRE